MSGVVAVFARDGSGVDAADVDAVLGRQAHRGPDGLRVWCDGPVGLGHAGLDPSGAGAALLPLSVDGGRLAITGDLRIDNRRDLIRDLGMSQSEVSDAETILEAYRRWGIDAPRHVMGAFAFVIWDARRQRVVCARDHLGQKPLTYHLSDRLVVAASEAEAVPCHRGVPRCINQARIADFLVSELEGIDHTSTFFRGVERLPPAHLLVVERDRHELRRYWQPDVDTELRVDSDEAYAEAFTHTFRLAVASCVTGVDRPALLLSGGIDSGAIAAVAGSLADAGCAPPLATFSFIDEARDRSPESPCIRRMVVNLAGDGTVLSPADVGRMKPASRQAFFNCGEPFDSLMVVPNLLSSTASAGGSRVVLDGVDGDVVASTASPTAHLLRRGRVLRAWREAAARRRLFPGAPHPLREVAGGVLRVCAPGGLRRVARRFKGRGKRVEAAIGESLIARDLAMGVRIEDRLEELWNRPPDNVAGDPRVAHCGAVTHPYVAAALERYDRVAARCGVEIRHPFLDVRLVELCLSLPWNLKVRDGWTKFVLRLAMEGRVPDEIRRRHDYGDVLWCATSRVIAEERSFLRSVIDAHRETLGPYVDQSKLENIRRALVGDPTELEEVGIWEASTLALWLARLVS